MCSVAAVYYEDLGDISAVIFLHDKRNSEDSGILGGLFKYEVGIKMDHSCL